MKPSKSLAIWFVVSLATVSCSNENEVKSADPIVCVEQAHSEDEKSSGDQTGNTNAGLDGVGNVTETNGNLRLDAKIVEEKITTATLKVLLPNKDDTVDQQATGKVSFRLARIDSFDGTKTFLDPTSRVCNEGEDEDEDECGDAYDCDEEDCSIEKPLVNGVAVLFNEETPYPAGEAISAYGVEIQAEYETRTTRGTFGGFDN